MTIKSHICGTSGKLNGMNCGFHLIDYLFERQLLTNFSWSGVSRRKEGKSTFKIYKNIMKLFYCIIQKADADFSIRENEIFLRVS